MPGLIDARPAGSGASWNDATVTNVYTVHDLDSLLVGDPAAHRTRRGGTA